MNNIPFAIPSSANNPDKALIDTARLQLLNPQLSYTSKKALYTAITTYDAAHAYGATVNDSLDQILITQIRYAVATIIGGTTYSNYVAAKDLCTSIRIPPPTAPTYRSPGSRY